MMEQVMEDFFRVEIPLPGSPLKSLNSYLIRAADRNLIIDTGLNRKECLAAMEKALTELKIDRGRTDFFITHLHADHFGLVGKLVTKESRTYFNRPDTEIIESWDGWGAMVDYAGASGFPRAELQAALESHPGYRFSSAWIPELSLLTEGDNIQAGEYLFRCVETPGHTAGHICLYEEQTKTLIAGDHLLGDITPNIQCWSDEDDPLKHYLESLDKVFELEVELVLPGHRRPFRNYRERIQELREHHKNRTAEILFMLARQPLSAFEAASRMTWDIACNSWEDFPLAQKWFATGEAIAHLRYLEELGLIAREGDRIRGQIFKLDNSAHRSASNLDL